MGTADVLLIVVAILLVALLAVMFQLLQRLTSTGQRIDELVVNVDKLMKDDIRPALLEARDAIKKMDSAAAGASNTLAAAEPLVNAASKFAGVFQKPTAPLWFDALRLAIGLFGVVQSKKALKEESEEE